MSRFFKSAAFPILIVVVLAFFVQKLVSPHSSEPVPSYGDFITQLDAGQVERVEKMVRGNEGKVVLDLGRPHERAVRVMADKRAAPIRGDQRFPAFQLSAGG